MVPLTDQPPSTSVAVVRTDARSEPESGSDVASLKCRAKLEDGEWVLNGSKMWCSYAHKASHTLIVCRTGEGSERHEGLSMISVPKNAEGLEIRPIETMGGEVVNDVFLTDCHVDADNLLGTENQGWVQLMAGLNVERFAKSKISDDIEGSVVVLSVSLVCTVDTNRKHSPGLPNA